MMKKKCAHISNCQLYIVGMLLKSSRVVNIGNTYAGLHMRSN